MLLALLLSTGRTMAEPAPTRLALETGAGRVISLAAPVANVFVADPKVAEVRPASSTALFVFGVGPGRTTVAALDAGGRPVAELLVTVSPSGFTASQAQATLGRLLPGSRVAVAATGRGLLLTGSVTSPVDAARAAAIAHGFAASGQEVVNELKVENTAQVTLQVRIVEMTRSLTRALGVNWNALGSIGAPSILKTRRLGYDGRGQVRVTHVDEASAAWAHTGGAPCILEGMVRFDREVSLIAARNRRGDIAFYPLTENIHRDGILRTSIAPFDNPSLQSQAEAYLRTLLEALDYIGVLAVEFFVEGDRLIANEMAPRVHNSGHWTIEGSATSQFENCLRAILGLPLGSTASQPTVMLNCIGAMPPEQETSDFPALFRHDYGKAPRPGRKVGHLTFPASEIETIGEWQHRLDPNV